MDDYELDVERFIRGKHTGAFLTCVHIRVVKGLCVFKFILVASPFVLQKNKGCFKRCIRLLQAYGLKFALARREAVTKRGPRRRGSPSTLVS